MDKAEMGAPKLGERPTQRITFQEAVMKLYSYWSSVGCIVWLPHNTEIGAGTMNPATFLRVLGPEPWNVCYAEPSIRPDDSRYGENPNRVQRHTQFQVILKPDPGNPQELYLKSLEAIGIDARAHDIRFVEDNWESPVLGAWGLGWEVWLDGMEITQFTYFQQSGGIPLPIPAIEITYGLERILMSLQNVQHFKQIRYTDSMTYGDLLLQTEIEMSQYNMDQAIIDDHWQRFRLYKEEAELMLQKGLALPAYDQLLKCSHTFNILDARGAIGVTERNVCFGSMRLLTRQVAAIWLDHRQAMDYPLIKPPTDTNHVDSIKAVAARSEAEPRLLLIEIGCEEMPPEDVMAAMNQLTVKMKELLEKKQLPYDEVTVQGTPRRVVLLVSALHGFQNISATKVKGPPFKIAFNEDGSPSKALLGFCRKNNCSVDSVTVETSPKNVQFVYGVKHEEPKNAADVLVEGIPDMIQSVVFRRSMRWNGDMTWSRPIRWITALHGDAVIPVQLAGLTATSSTRLVRREQTQMATIPSSESYSEIIQSTGITLDSEARRQIIWDRAAAEAATVQGIIPDRFAANLLEEITYLVEAPSPLLGSFEAEFLSLPVEVLETVMQKYQRYFAVYCRNDPDRILPHFIAIGNGDFNRELARSGYEAVLGARFRDAQFFYNEDMKQSLESFRPRLSGTMFHKELGTLLEKSERTEALIGPMAELMEMETAVVGIAKRAAALSKADLATSLVTEMTSLAGTIGRNYALNSGEPSAVAEAIFESVLPRFAGDRLPATPAGILASVADKIDSLVGLVAVKCAPTAAADPYGLRRMAYGLVEALIANEKSLDVPKAVQAAAALQPITVPHETVSEVCAFIERRLEQFLLDKDIMPEIVKSVLNERSGNPFLAAKGAMEVAEEIEKGPDSYLISVMTAMGRISRILKKNDVTGAVDTTLFQQTEESDLWDAFLTAHDDIQGSMAVGEFLRVFQSDVVTKVNAFFDVVFVMTDDLSIRKNRLRLLKAIKSLSVGIVDFSMLPGM